MMKKVLGLLLAVAILGVLMLFRGGGDGLRPEAAESSKKQASIAPAGKASSDIVLSIAPGLKRAPAPQDSRVSPLIREVRTARDLKPIYDRLKALPNPSPEEAYVLATMLEACAKVTDRKGKPNEPLNFEESKARFVASLSPKAPNRDKRIAAFDAALRGGCAGFEGVETTEQGIRDLLAHAAAGGDPKAQARLLAKEVEDARRDAKGEIDWNRPVSISDDQIERFKRIVASGDPRALVDVIGAIGWNADVHLRGPDEAPINNQLLYYASTLAACELGYPCGTESATVAGACAFNGQCDSADYRDYLLFYELAPGNAQLVMQYQAQLLRVIREGDWSYFTFQRGPAPITAIVSRGK